MCQMSYFISFWIHISFLGLVLCKQYQRNISEAERLNVTCLSSEVNNIVNVLNWTSVALIQDQNEGLLFSERMKLQIYCVDNLDNRILRDIHNLLFPDINIIIALNKTSTAWLLEQLDNFDFNSNRTTDFRHNSRILILANTMSILHTLTVNHLDNVVVLMQDDESCVLSDNPTNRAHVFTLHNTPEGKVFIPVPDTRATTASHLSWVYPNTQYGYNNRRLLVSTIESPRYVVKQITNGTTIYTGYVFDILDTISKKLNFSYDVIEPTDLSWGLFVNGSWDGLVAQLSRREIDIVAADLTIHYGRSQVVEYILPAIRADGSDIIYRMKTDTARSFYLVAKPLKVEVYITFAAAIGGLFIVFVLVENPNSIFTTKCDRTSAMYIRQLPSICWQFVGSVFRQGFQMEPRTYAGKILLSSSWLLVIVVSSVYSANMMAALTAGTGKLKLSSISELVDSDYTVGVYDTGIVFQAMKTSQKTSIRRLYEKMKTLSEQDAEIFLSDHERHTAKVKEGTHAFITYRSSAEQSMAEDCHLAVIGEPVTWENELLAFATPKSYPLTSEIGKVMRQLKESGMMDVWWRRRITNESDNSCGVDRSVKTITIQDVLGGFLVVCGGLGLSCVMLMLELCRHQLHNM